MITGTLITVIRITVVTSLAQMVTPGAVLNLNLTANLNHFPSKPVIRLHCSLTLEIGHSNLRKRTLIRLTVWIFSPMAIQYILQSIWREWGTVSKLFFDYLFVFIIIVENLEFCGN